MGITFGSKERESIADNITLKQVKTIGYIDDMIGHSESLLTYYKQGLLTKSVTELDRILWHAGVIRERIKRE